MSKYSAKLLSVVLLHLLLTLPAIAQIRNDNVFSSLPEPHRSRLIQRLNLYIQYARRHQFAKLYDLYDRYTLTELMRGESRESYIQGSRGEESQGKYITLLEFKPTAMKPIKSQTDRYEIRGRAKEWTEYNGEVVIWTDKVTIEATLQGEEWYFSPVIGKGELRSGSDPN